MDTRHYTHTTTEERAGQRRCECGQMVQRRDVEAEQYMRKQEAAIAACTREELTKWIAELEEGRSLRHRGVSIKASENNINYMKSVLQTK